MLQCCGAEFPFVQLTLVYSRSTVIVYPFWGAPIRAESEGAENMDIIELGTIIEETKGGVGCLVEAINCSPWSGERR